MVKHTSDKHQAINNDETQELGSVKTSWFSNPVMKIIFATLVFIVPFLITAGIWAATTNERIVKLETCATNTEKLVDMKLENLNQKIINIKETTDDIKQLLKERK